MLTYQVSLNGLSSGALRAKFRKIPRLNISFNCKAAKEEWLCVFTCRTSSNPAGTSILQTLVTSQPQLCKMPLTALFSQNQTNVCVFFFKPLF